MVRRSCCQHNICDTEERSFGVAVMPVALVDYDSVVLDVMVAVSLCCADDDWVVV